MALQNGLPPSPLSVNGTHEDSLAKDLAAVRLANDTSLQQATPPTNLPVGMNSPSGPSLVVPNTNLKQRGLSVTPHSEPAPVVQLVRSPVTRVHRPERTSVGSLTATISSDGASTPSLVNDAAQSPAQDDHSTVQDIEFEAKLPYFHYQLEGNVARAKAAQSSPGGSRSPGSPASVGQRSSSLNPAALPGGSSLSVHALGVDGAPRARVTSEYLSPSHGSPYARRSGSSSALDLTRPESFMPKMPDTLTTESPINMVITNNPSLLSNKETLSMYLKNLKTLEMEHQYEFAVFLVTAAQQMEDAPSEKKTKSAEPEKPTRQYLIRQAKEILQTLADNRYMMAQYYLGDGYSSGLFNKNKPDHTAAFAHFMAASKQEHPESCFRAAICLENGWGTWEDATKSAHYYRRAAVRHHPGAATRLAQAWLEGNTGIVVDRREGFKWLKRATEKADVQYNEAPYLMGQLYEMGTEDIFADEVHALELYSEAAELGNLDACVRLGEIFEQGLRGIKPDPVMSLSYYTTAAMVQPPETVYPKAMYALCAWYLIGIPGHLEKDDDEAYAWAKRASEYHLPRAMYTVGYFTERGVGCSPDPLEANVWYVKAAEAGDSLAKERLEAMQEAAGSTFADPKRTGKVKKKTLQSKRSANLLQPLPTDDRPSRKSIFSILSGR